MPNSNNNFSKELFAKLVVYIVLITTLLTIICFYDQKWIIPSIIIFLAIIIYSAVNTSKQKNELFNHIQELTSDVNSATKNNLINSPIPLVLIETDGKIIWKSKKFVEEFAGIEINTYLIPIVKEIKIDLENTAS